MMIDRINDIAWQARQGSVAAIIQILNEKLADAQVRTRAVFADGVLQLLCEAQTADSLDRSTLVTQIREILQSISPRNIYRVNINSRIVREQQLLWLEEINRDTENQLLWSEEIFLEKPGFFKSFVEDFKQRQGEANKHYNFSVANPSRPIVIVKNNRRHQSFLGWSIVITSVCSCFLLFAGIAYILWGNKIKSAIQSDGLSVTQASFPAREKSLNSGSPPQIASSPKPTAVVDQDYFADAVRIANRLSQQGKSATTKTQWLEIAANWQRASDLMGQVDANHQRYQEAKIRTQLYREYSLEARKRADL